MELLGLDLSVSALSLSLMAAVVLIGLWYDWSCHQYFQRLGIPVPGYIPIFGNILQWRHGVQYTFTDYVKKYGKIVGMYDFRRPVLIISDPDILKNVLVKNFSNFTNRRIFPLGQEPLDRGISQLVNEEWKEVRNVITPSFSASKMKRMSYMINECCDTLVGTFKRESEGGHKAVDCRKIFGGFTMDAIARCGFGLSVNSQEKADDPFVMNARKAFDISLFQPAFLLVSAFPALEPVLRYFKYDIFDPSVIKFFMNVTEQACKMRKEEGDKAGKNIDLLQLMLNAHNDDERHVSDSKSVDKIRHRQLSTHEVMAQAITFFLAGYETTNTLLSFAAYLLAINQDIQEKLHAEIKAMAPTRENLGYEVISKMEYLDMVISETLRMYPPAVVFDRMCNETITYDGYTIEKGVNVMICSWTLHYDDDYWTEPTKFDPERFSMENKGSIKPCTYVPFGFGPRNCIAMRFALLEAKMAVVRVLQNYRFDVSSETVIPPILGKTGILSPKTMILSAIPRE